MYQLLSCRGSRSCISVTKQRDLKSVKMSAFGSALKAQNGPSPPILIASKKERAPKGVKPIKSDDEPAAEENQSFFRRYVRGTECRMSRTNPLELMLLSVCPVAVVLDRPDRGLQSVRLRSGSCRWRCRRCSGCCLWWPASTINLPSLGAPRTV